MTIGLNLALGITMRESVGNANNKIHFLAFCGCILWLYCRTLSFGTRKRLVTDSFNGMPCKMKDEDGILFNCPSLPLSFTLLKERRGLFLIFISSYEYTLKEGIYSSMFANPAFGTPSGKNSLNLQWNKAFAPLVRVKWRILKTMFYIDTLWSHENKKRLGHRSGWLISVRVNISYTSNEVAIFTL